MIPILFSQLCYFPVLEPLSMVHQAEMVYMSSSFWLFAVGSRDLSQAEKEITAWKAEKNNKMTITIFVCFKGSRRWYAYFA